MTYRKYLLIGVFALLYCEESLAQFKLPTFDAELKIHQNLIPGDGSEDGNMAVVETTNIYGGAHVQINQHIAIGGFYSRSFRGNGRIRYESTGDVDQEVLYLQKGVDVRLSTGRAKKWRHYLTVNYSQVEMVMVSEAYRLADKTGAFGASYGIMRRLSNNLYLNVIELGMKFMGEPIFWFNTSDKIILDGKIGVTYNIGKRK